jgi:Ca-activated chloride channel family protein
MRHLALFALALALVAPTGVRAQDGDSDDVVELDTTLVEVPVVVSEPGGRYVVDLAESDFTVYENGARQQVEFFASVDEPISVALVLDTSGSTREQLERIKSAASAFLDQLRPNDRVALVSFEDEVRVLAPFTSDRARLRQALASLVPGEYTQVYEAVHTVAANVFEDTAGRKAAILFTDGVDTASAVSGFEDSLDDISAKQVIVYPIRFNTRPDVEARVGVARPPEDGTSTVVLDDEARRSRRVADVSAERARTLRGLDDAYHVADAYLYEIASRTGGVLYRADRLEDLPSAFAKIADELRHQYLVGYYPANKTLDDSERHIAVTVSRPGVTVRAREGYRRR